MTNRFDFGVKAEQGGWTTYYLMVSRADPFVLRDGKHDIIFASKLEALEAAGNAFKAYLNSPISGMTAPSVKAYSEGDAAFNLKPFVKARCDMPRKNGSSRFDRRR